MNKELLNEVFGGETAGAVSGEDVANLLGMGDAYRRGKEEIAHDNEMMESFKSKFNNLSERMHKVPKGIKLYE